MWDYVKRPNLRLLGVPECHKENESKLENTQKSNPKAHNHHIHRGEMKDKMLREAREKGRVTHKAKPIRLTADLSAETLQPEESGGQYSTSSKNRTFSPEFHIQPN